MCRRWARLERAGSGGEVKQNAMVAIALIILNRVIIPIVDMVAKLLQTEPRHYSPFHILWVRFTTQTLILLPLALWHHGYRALLRSASVLVISRGCLQFAATVTFYCSLRFVALADASAIVFVAPIATTVLAALLLGEHVGPQRWVAVAAGLLAVLVIARPGFAHFHPAFALLLLCALSVGAYNVLTRWLRSTPPLLLYTWQVLCGFLPLSVFAPLYLQRPERIVDGAMMLTVGLLALSAHGLVILAMRRGEASLLAPFFYLDIVGQATLGFAVFGDVPDAPTWLGIAVLVSLPRPQLETSWRLVACYYSPPRHRSSPCADRCSWGSTSHSPRRRLHRSRVRERATRQLWAMLSYQALSRQLRMLTTARLLKPSLRMTPRSAWL